MVRERLELDLSRAISALSQLDTALRGAAVSFSSALSRAVQQAQSVHVTGDTSGLTRQIDQAVERADTQPEVTAGDTSALTHSIDGAVDAADTTVSPKVDDASIRQAKEASDSLGGSLRRAVEIAGGLGIALSAQKVLQFIGDSILASSSLTEAINQTRVTFLDAADDVLRFGEGASESVGLAEDQALKAAGTFGNLFKATGASAGAAAEMSIKMTTLAADLASFRDIPIEDALIRIQSGLVGEIEPLRRVGVLLNAAAVEQQAMADTGKTNADQITEQEKVAARYKIILEQTTDAQGDFTRTGDQLANMLRTLAAQVRQGQIAFGNELAPELQRQAGIVSKEMLPALEETGVAIGRLAATAIPLLGSSLASVTNILTVATNLLELVPPPVAEAVLNFTALARIMGPTTQGFGALATGVSVLIPGLRGISPGIADAAQQVALLGAVGHRLGAANERIGATAGTAAGAIFGLGQAVGGQQGNILSFGAAGALAGQALIPIPGLGAAAGAALGGLAGALLGAGESAVEARQEISDLATEIKGLAPAAAAARFLSQEVDTLALTAAAAARSTTASIEEITQASFLGAGRASDAFADMRRDLRLLAEESPGAAENVIQGLRAQESQLPLTEQQWAALEETVARGTGKFQENSAAAAEVAARDQEIAGAATSATDAQKAAAEAFQSFVDTVVGTLPTADAVLGQTGQALSRFGVSLSDSVSPQAFLEDLNATIDNIVNFQARLELISAAGFHNVAATIAAAGPEVGGAYATAFLQADPLIQAATDRQLGVLSSLPGNFAAFMQGPGGQLMASAYQGALAPLPDLSFGGIASAGAAINSGAPVIQAAAQAAGGQLPAGFQAGTAPLPGVAAAATGTAAGGINQGATGLLNPAYQAGAFVGGQFGEGVAGGIASRSGTVADAARNLVQIAKEAGRREAEAASPSRLAAREIGAPFGEGVAQGIRSAIPAVARASQELVGAAMGPSIPGALPGARTAGGRAAGGATDLGPVVAALARLRGGDAGGSRVVLIRVDTLAEAAAAAGLSGADLSFLE